MLNILFVRSQYQEFTTTYKFTFYLKAKSNKNRT